MSAADGYIITYTGREFFMLDPTEDSIDIKDIAHALSLTCRWGGHCPDMYSVAEHSYYASIWAEYYGGTTQDALWGLLHDAAEAYIGDVPAPFKSYISNYREIENNILAAIMRKFGLPEDMPPVIHSVDKRLMKEEAIILMGNPEWCHNMKGLGRNFNPTIMTPAEAEFLFLNRFEELTKV